MRIQTTWLVQINCRCRYTWRQLSVHRIKLEHQLKWAFPQLWKIKGILANSWWHQLKMIQNADDIIILVMKTCKSLQIFRYGKKKKKRFIFTFAGKHQTNKIPANGYKCIKLVWTWIKTDFKYVRDQISMFCTTRFRLWFCELKARAHFLYAECN